MMDLSQSNVYNQYGTFIKYNDVPKYSDVVKYDYDNNFYALNALYLTKAVKYSSHSACVGI